LGINNSDYPTSFDSILLFLRPTNLKLEAVSRYDFLGITFVTAMPKNAELLTM